MVTAPLGSMNRSPITRFPTTSFGIVHSYLSLKMVPSFKVNEQVRYPWLLSMTSTFLPVNFCVVCVVLSKTQFSLYKFNAKIGGWWLTHSLKNLNFGVTSSYVSPRSGLNGFWSRPRIWFQPVAVVAAKAHILRQESGWYSDSWLNGTAIISADFCKTESGSFKNTGSEKVDRSLPIKSFRICHITEGFIFKSLVLGMDILKSSLSTGMRF